MTVGHPGSVAWRCVKRRDFWELSITQSAVGQRTFFTAYLRDLTDQKRAEQERLKLEAHLIEPEDGRDRPVRRRCRVRRQIS